MPCAALGSDVYPVLLAHREQRGPRGILDVDAIAQALDTAQVLYLARIEHPAEPVRGGRLLEVARELGHLALEGGQITKRGDLEDRDEAAVVVPARRFDAEAEAGQQGRQDLDHGRERGSP